MAQFSEDYGSYILELDGIVFVWADEPDVQAEELAARLAESYRRSIENIIDFVYPELVDMYGEFPREETEERLGTPSVDIEMCEVTFLEQTFDDHHIFSFEFEDGDFESLEYFSVNG